MKSNFMIQAEIDIKNHPEWNYAEREYCIFMAYIKEENIKKKQPELTKDNLDALINSVRAATYMPQPIPFTNDQDELTPTQYQRGLRANRIFFDDVAIIGGIN